MLVSIIILTHNADKTIGKLLKKISYSSGNLSKEIIIVDSQSTDATLNIVKKYKTKIINIRPSEFNHGQTRNLGIKIAKGKYVCFFSQDALPSHPNIINRYINDLELKKDAVAVFGQQIPYKNSPFFQKLEVICRFEQLDKYVDKNGLLVQSKKSNLTPLLLYTLSNVSSCYKKSFLLKHPFPKTDYGEDLLIGKMIIEKGFAKIYDSKAIIFHSHSYNLFEYYRRERKDLNLRFVKLNLPASSNIGCKIRKILSIKISFIKKLNYLFELGLYYLIKLFIVIKLRLVKSS